MDSRLLEIIYGSLNRLDQLHSSTYVEIQTRVFFYIQKINENLFSIKSDSGVDTTFSNIEELENIIKDTGIIKSIDYYDYSGANGSQNLWRTPSARLDERIEERGILREPISSDMFEECGICSRSLDIGFICKVNNEECNHYFHCKCLNNWFKKGKNSCPICRRNSNRSVALKHVSPFKFGKVRGSEVSYLKQLII